MSELSVTRVLVRRVLLLTIMGSLVALLVIVGWRIFLNRAGGHFQYAPEDAPWVLSDEARKLVASAFHGLGKAVIVDYHVGVISQGSLGDAEIDNDSYYRREYDQNDQDAGPLTRIVTHLRLTAAGVGNLEAVDGRYVSRLLRQIRAMPGSYKVHLLARGWRYTHSGRRNKAGTYTHVANAYVWWLAQQAPEVVVPVVSIHPYRQDALKVLAQWADKGVHAVAWWPVRQNIDLGDPRSKAFYTAMAKYDMVLQVPVGTIDTVYAPGTGAIAPQLLQLPLGMGVTVIARVHAGESGVGGKRITSRLLRLVNSSHGDRLQIMLAGAFTSESASSVLMTLLQHPDLYGHLRYASGYPLSAVDMRIDLDALADEGFIRARNIAPLREIYHVNPLLFVYVLSRTVRLPSTSLQLPLSVFTGGKLPETGETGSN